MILNDSLINTDQKLKISRKEIQFEAGKTPAIWAGKMEYQKTIKNTSILGEADL